MKKTKRMTSATKRSLAFSTVRFDQHACDGKAEAGSPTRVRGVRPPEALFNNDAGIYQYTNDTNVGTVIAIVSYRCFPVRSG